MYRHVHFVKTWSLASGAIRSRRRRLPTMTPRLRNNHLILFCFRIISFSILQAIRPTSHFSIRAFRTRAISNSLFSRLRSHSRFPLTRHSISQADIRRTFDVFAYPVTARLQSGSTLTILSVYLIRLGLISLQLAPSIQCKSRIRFMHLRWIYRIWKDTL